MHIHALTRYGLSIQGHDMFRKLILVGKYPLYGCVGWYFNHVHEMNAVELVR